MILGEIDSRGLANLRATLYFINKHLRRFKAWHIVLIYYDGGVFRYVSGNFLGPLFINKATKTSNIDVFAISHGVFNYIKKCFYCYTYIGLVDTGFICNLRDYVCFSHVKKGLIF